MDSVHQTHITKYNSDIDNNRNLPPCVHGFNIKSTMCPYTLSHNGLRCSMPHIDQPNGKFN